MCDSRATGIMKLLPQYIHFHFIFICSFVHSLLQRWVMVTNNRITYSQRTRLFIQNNAQRPARRTIFVVLFLCFSFLFAHVRMGSVACWWRELVLRWAVCFVLRFASHKTNTSQLRHCIFSFCFAFYHERSCLLDVFAILWSAYSLMVILPVGAAAAEKILYLSTTK